MNSTTYSIKAFGELIANIPGLLGAGISDSIVAVSLHRSEGMEDTAVGSAPVDPVDLADAAWSGESEAEALETGGIWRVDIGDTQCWDIIGQRMQHMGAVGAIIIVISEQYFGNVETPGLEEAIRTLNGTRVGAYAVLSVGKIVTGAPYVHLDNPGRGTVGEVQGSWAMTQSVVRGREVLSDQHSLESYFAQREVVIDDDIENRAFVQAQSIDSQWARYQDATLALDTFHRWLDIVQAIDEGADFATEIATDDSQLMVIATVVQSGVCRDLLHIYSFHSAADAMRQILRETAHISTGWVRALSLSLWSAMSIATGPTVLTYRAACEALNTGARPSLATSLELTVGVGRAHWCCAVLLIGSLSMWNEIVAAGLSDAAPATTPVIEHLHQRLDGDGLVAYIEQHRDDDADDAEELARFFGSTGDTASAA